MSISQSLITSQRDFDIFAPSWQAGVASSQCLTKSLKNYDIEGVNVAKTCEKLSIAVEKKSKSTDMSPLVTDNENQCIVSKSNMPFRAASNIWFGTLKIYQQQVNTLFRLSQDLLARSYNCNVRQVEASKRKSSSTSTKMVKKTCLTLSGSKDKKYCTNYSQQLEDLEKLIKEPLGKSLNENNFCQSSPGAVTQLQVREITIREISATTYITSDEIYEDSEFGQATHEEIAAFFNFIEDHAVHNTNLISKKRKSTCEQDPPTMKKCRIKKNYSSESLSDENSPWSENSLEVQPLKRSIAFTTGEGHANKIEVNNFCQQHYIESNDYVKTNEIKEENLSFIEDKPILNTLGVKKKKNNLIIDECTKIDISEIMEEMKNFEIINKFPKTIKLKSYKSKRNPTALELLTSFNRRSLRLTLTLKRRFYLPREKFEHDYINLLREIFKITYKESLAFEIYPKWNCFDDALHKKKKKINKFRNQKNIAMQSETDINNIYEIDSNYLMEYRPTLSININNIKSLNTCSYKEWRPHGVMQKLFNLWHFNQTKKITAATLFKQAKNSIDRAVGFNSLLYLSKIKLVSLTSFPKSIELQNVLMGTAATTNKTNGFAL